MPDAARAVNRNPPDLSRENHQSPVSTSDNALRHVIDGSLSFVFSDHTCRIQCDVSMTLTTTTHSPQQLMAVWNLRLHSDSEGPAFISSTALKPKELTSTPEPPIPFGTHGGAGTADCGSTGRYVPELRRYPGAFFGSGLR